MNAYDIIIERGYLGALKYADSIESSNITLASEIDNAVTELYKNASGIGMVKTAQSVEGAYPMPNYTPFRSAPQTYSPSAAPGQSYPTQQRTFSPYQPKQAPNETLNTGMGGFQNALPGVAKYQALSGGAKWLWERKNLAHFQNLIEKIKTTRAIQPKLSLIEEAAKLLGRVPRGYVYRNGVPVEIVEEYIKLLPNSPTIQKAILKQAIDFGFRPPMNLANILQQNPLAARLMQSLPGAKSHPIINSWVPKSTLNTIQQNLVKQLKNKTPQEALDFLVNKSEIGLADDLALHMERQAPAALKGVLTEQIGKVNPKAVGTGTGALIQEFFIAVGAKYPFLKPAMGFISKAGKFLGPLAVAFEGKGLWDHVSKYGWDARAVCLGLSTVLGVASLFPALTPVVGPIWAAVSIGCAILTPEQAEQKKTELYKDLTNDKIKSIKDTVNFNSLSPKDQVIVTEILNTAQGDPQKIQSLVAEAKQSQKFENPLNSLAVIYGEWERNGKIN